MNDASLFHLADEAGLSLTWTDAYNQPQQVSAESLAAVLKELGLPAATQQQRQESHEILREINNPYNLPPLVTGVIGQPVRLAVESQQHGKTYQIIFEDGSTRNGRFPDDTSMPLEIAPIMQPGYHRLVIDWINVTLAIAPSRCFGVADALHGHRDAARADANNAARDRLWGLSAQLYSLKREGDGGLGDFTALGALVSDAAKKGASALAISPIHAMFAADPGRFSPYGPSSRLFLNALHIDPGKPLPDTMGADGLIDWSAAAAVRQKAFRELYAAFQKAGHFSEYEQFVKEGGRALELHAVYEAIQGYLHQQAGQGPERYAANDWRNWPREYHDPDGSAVQAFAEQHKDEIRFHLFLQWRAATELSAVQKNARASGMAIGLIADLAVGADSGGSQAWSQQDQFLLGLSVGAPPDLLNVLGQSWGLGAFSPHAMRRRGFSGYIAMLRACFAHAGGVRIDHVLGLGRLWLVPQGAAATEGAYLRFPIQDMLRLIALESWRYRAIVIGEDLGTVPAGFGDVLAQQNLLGIRVMFFQRDQHRYHSPDSWGDVAMSTTATHDLPTVAGWWTGADIEWRATLGLLEPGRTPEQEQALRSVDRTALWERLCDSGVAAGPQPAISVEAAPLDASAALIGLAAGPLAMLQMDDLLGVEQQANLPGTVHQHPNWRRRLPSDVNGMLDKPEVVARMQHLANARAAAAAGLAKMPLTQPYGTRKEQE